MNPINKRELLITLKLLIKADIDRLERTAFRIVNTLEPHNKEHVAYSSAISKLETALVYVCHELLNEEKQGDQNEPKE